MDHLWSPWRYRYISTAESAVDCIFCARSQDENDDRHLIVHRGEHNFIIVNLYPYTSGHLMVVPYSHLASLEDAEEPVAIEMMLLARRTQRILREVYRAPGCNLGMNIGSAAGAGIAGHIHLHVLPRWHGDVNFMTTIAETRVIPEDLQDTYLKLRSAFQSG